MNTLSQRSGLSSTRKSVRQAKTAVTVRAEGETPSTSDAPSTPPKAEFKNLIPQPVLELKSSFPEPVAEMAGKAMAYNVAYDSTETVGDLFSFENSVGPERINGRLAMLGFIAAFGA